MVDRYDHEIKPKMKELIHTHSETAPQVEVLDQETFALLQRLAAGGIITINAEAAQALYRSASANRVHETEKEQRLVEAKRSLAEAERKMRMGQLLASGGFAIEALPAVSEALEFGLKSYSALKKGAHQEGEVLLQSVKKGTSKIASEEAISLIGMVDGCLQEYAEEVTRYALA